MKFIILKFEIQTSLQRYQPAIVYSVTADEFESIKKFADIDKMIEHGFNVEGI